MEFWPEFLANSVMKEFVAGGIGGMAGVISGHPLDTLKIRLQQPSTSHVGGSGSSAFHLLRHIFSTEGPSALYKGMGAPLATVAFQNAVSFQTYAMVSRALSSKSNEEQGCVKNVALAGLAAGAIPTVILTPVELVKIRLQLQQTREHGVPSKARILGPLELVRNIISKDGIRGLYRGFFVTILRDAPAIALYFSTYEFAREWLQPGCRKNGNETVFTMLNAGGFAGMASWISCYPLDVIKSRLQAQVGPPRYAGIIDCFRKSVKEEGFSVLWRGLGTAITRAYVVNGAIFCSYELALRLMSNQEVTTDVISTSL